MGIRQQDQSANGVLLMEIFLIMLPMSLGILGFTVSCIYDEYCLTKREKARIQLEIEQLKLKRAELENGSK